jgi:hypothetical protein
MATERFEKNVISQIADETGRMVTNHDEKSALFWNEFRRRLGSSVDTEMQFDLQAIVKQHDNLENLCIPFSKEEIDHVILDLPSDKAPGPDGFNNLFIKKCCLIIRNDMYKLCFDFFHHQADLKSINHSYITLVPKKDNSEKVNDFRPISLLNSSINMVTKLLANRLQTLAMEIVHENQYGFIKGKTIQDCLGWAFEFLHQCHHSRREIIILKLDFEKAFDLIEHSAVLAMLQAKGFPQKWIMWINELLSSETSFVLLNGTAGKDFKCIRGVRQGDPLSPLLFAIDADLLQCAINKEYEIGNLHPPFPQRTENPFPIIQYADDTIIIMQGCDSQLAILKDILNKISVSSSLVVNFHKSCLVPINISSEHASSLAQSFGCTVGSFPFTYLGLSMGLNKPQVKDYAPLNCRIERKLAAASLHLSYAARLQLVNSVISSLPTYYMCTLKLPITVLTLLISTRRTAFGEAENSIEKDTIWLLGTWSENQRIKEVLVLLI